MGRDSEDPHDDVQYHLEVGPGDVADTVLLPGNPERVDTITAVWDDADEKAHHREYRTCTGTHDGTPLSVTSTGIGAPSTAIAVEELARVGADTLIRVGSCGAIQDAGIGDLVITRAAVRQEGTSDEYIREDYPAAADDRVVQALVAAAEELGYDYHVGITCSTDSFYTGQSRPAFDGYRAAFSDERLDELRQANVINFEMEAAALLTLANLYGLRASAVCTVVADRETGAFRVEGEEKAARVASRAAGILAAMDDAADDNGAQRWHPGLHL